MMTRLQCLILGLLALSGSASGDVLAKDVGPTLKMDTIGPPELEADIKPYQHCLWQWTKNRSGTYRALRSEMDFESGPTACVSERQTFLAKGFADLAKKVPDEIKRRQYVQLQLVGANIEMFGAIVWMSQFETESQ